MRTPLRPFTVASAFVALGASVFFAVACGGGGAPAPTAPPAPTPHEGPADASAGAAPVADAQATEAPASAGAAPTTSGASGASGASGEEERVPDIEYVPTPNNVVDKLLEAANITKNDVLYDLGCGDGRIVIAAAKKYGIRAKGFDIDPARVKESRINVRKAHVEEFVTIEQKDIFNVDLSAATVVTLYLLPELNVRLIPQLQKLKAGSRVVSHDFDMEGIVPEQTWTLMAPDHRNAKKLREHYVYLWKTPLRKVTAAPAK